MKNFDVNFQYPLRLLVIIPALVAILIPLLRMPKKRRTLKKKLPAVLHSAVAILLALAIAGMQFSSVSSDQSVIVLVDESESTSKIREELDSTAQQIVDSLDSDIPVAAVCFSDKQYSLFDFDSQDRSIWTDNFLHSNSTNIEGALEHAASLFPQDRAKRIILISDGRETDGNAAGAVRFLSNRGIRVDALHLNTVLEGNDIQVDSVKCPSGAHVGDEISITATVTSTCTAPVTLRLNKSAYALKELRSFVTEGENTFEFTMPIEEAGKHTFNITVSAGEQYNSVNRNDVGYCCVNASSSISILVITNKVEDAAPLKSALSDEYTVIAVNTRECPATMVELCNYDAIVMLNIDMATLPEGFDKILRDYVEVQGRSLLLCGGGSTFMYGNMVGTELEAVMPVDFTVTEQSKGDSIAVMLLMDTSLSMAGSYITMAKEGATKVVDALSSKDYIGLISFNQFAVMNFPLSPATELLKQQIAESISGMGTMNQTIFTRPLQMAYSELYNSDAAVRMAVILSDGGPSDKTYTAVAKQMAADGITVSAIGLGFPSTILAALAQDGCGHFSYATTSDDLPGIILGEAEQQAMSAVHLGESTLVISHDSDLTEGLTDYDLPAIRGYMPTVLKEGKTACITTSEGVPVYAVCDSGKGKAAVFTSDLSDGWCQAWFASEAGRTMINRMISTTLSTEPHGSSMTADISHRGKTISAVLHTAGSAVPVTAEIQVSNIYGSHTLTMNPAQKNTFKCAFIADREGAYDVTFALKDADGNVLDYLNSFFSVDYSDEYDSFSSDGRNLMDQLAAGTGGVVTDDIDVLASATASDTVVYRDPVMIIAAACCALTLLDIAIRKLRWADLRGLFSRKT